MCEARRGNEHICEGTETGLTTDQKSGLGHHIAGHTWLRKEDQVWVRHGERLAETAEAAVPKQQSGKSSNIKHQMTTCSSTGKRIRCVQHPHSDRQGKTTDRVSTNRGYNKQSVQQQSVHEQRMEQHHEAMRTVGCFSYVSTERMVPATPGVNLRDIQ